jgi:hypothetical protein
MKIIIEDNVPFESKSLYRKPLIEMQSGQSFKFPIEDQKRVSVLAYQIKKGGFKIRKISKTEYRIWKL